MASKTKKVRAIHTLRMVNELGDMEDFRPGSVVSVEASEADRLVSIRAAVWPDPDDAESDAKVQALKDGDDEAVKAAKKAEADAEKAAAEAAEKAAAADKQKPKGGKK